MHFSFFNFGFLIIINLFKLIEVTRKLLGKRLFSKFMKATFFSHFAGGEDGNEIKPLVKQLRKSGITGMVIYNAEDDLSGNQSSSTNTSNDSPSGTQYYHESEKKNDIFVKNTIDCIDTAGGFHIIILFTFDNSFFL